MSSSAPAPSDPPGEVRRRAPSGGIRWLRVLLCACALAFGAGAAELHASTGVSRAAGATKPATKPEAGRAPATRTTEPALLRVEPFRVPSPIALSAASGGSVPSLRSRSGLGEELRDGAIITGATPHRLVLFTFDDGPDRRTTPLLLDRLDEAGIRAVFFLVASRFAGATPVERQDAAVAREITRRGHLVGNHTLTHAQLPLLDEAAALHEIISAEAIFEDVLGGRPWLFRPPFGAHSQRIDSLLAERGYTTLLWNLGSGDFQVRSAQDVFDTWLKVFERRELEHGDRGGIILLHDTYAWSVDAFERIVSYLRARNCALLASGEELYDFVDDPTLFFVAREGQPADTLAPPLRLSPEVLEARQAPLRETESLRCRSLATGH
jgi:peptidoglycan/xylan/chitin deacetylase (PgdA/CDA1 family)